MSLVSRIADLAARIAAEFNSRVPHKVIASFDPPSDPEIGDIWIDLN